METNWMYTLIKLEFSQISTPNKLKVTPKNKFDFMPTFLFGV